MATSRALILRDRMAGFGLMLTLESSNDAAPERRLVAVMNSLA